MKTSRAEEWRGIVELIELIEPKLIGEEIRKLMEGIEKQTDEGTFPIKGEGDLARAILHALEEQHPNLISTEEDDEIPANIRAAHAATLNIYMPKK